MDDPSTCTETSEVWAQPGLVCGRDQFYTCQMVVRGSWGTPEWRCVRIGGVTPRNHWAQEGVFRGEELLTLLVKPH
jgi:hypothetical protein